MFSRIRIAFVFAVLALMIAAISVSAKGGFAFITIAGAGLDETVRAANGELTHDFFAFADFYRNKADAPADPGVGYEITRYYVDNNREVAFDRLHYYPETGFVFYDGIVNGSSEYDGKWYTARAEIKAVFESVLPATAIAAPLSGEAVQQQPSEPIQQTRPNPSSTLPPVAMPVVVTLSLAVLLILFLSRRRRMAQ